MDAVCSDEQGRLGTRTVDENRHDASRAVCSKALEAISAAVASPEALEREDRCGPRRSDCRATATSQWYCRSVETDPRADLDPEPIVDTYSACAHHRRTVRLRQDRAWPTSRSGCARIRGHPNHGPAAGTLRAKQTAQRPADHQGKWSSTVVLRDARSCDPGGRRDTAVKSVRS